MAAPATTTDVSALGNAAFANDMYNVLKGTSGNLFFSPYSLQVALAMTYAGAGGNTAKELQQGLSFSEDKAAITDAIKTSMASLRSTEDMTLDVANGIFVQENYDVRDSYRQTIAEVFQAEAKTMNFANSKESADTINGFVNDKTRGKIPQLFEPNAFSEMTRMVLVNAIYFKGTWVNQFDAFDTRPGTFHLDKERTIEVPFMSTTKSFNWGENDLLKSTILELPYLGGVSMVLIVPKEIDGLKHVESNLKSVDLKNLTQGTVSTEVFLKMPKFKMEQTYDLKTPLKELGIREMFDQGKANFAEITEKKDLYVSEVVQKAIIEVNEKGSEAAAATGVQFLMRRMPMPPEILHVDHPFLFFLQSTEGEVLFLGRVTKL